MIDTGNISSFILWGPPGVGKTTLAYIISKQLNRPFFSLSAVSSGVKEVREVIAKAKDKNFFSRQTPILFIDEIHRFSKSQQDALLGAVEDGTIILIGATTENPSFEVISPLLSRCQVYVLKELTAENLDTLLTRALEKDEYLKTLNIKVKEKEALFRYSGGDARKLLNILEIITSTYEASSAVSSLTRESAKSDKKSGKSSSDHVKFAVASPTFLQINKKFESEKVSSGAVDVVNWPKANGDYKPVASFKIMYTDTDIYIQYNVKEKALKAVFDKDENSQPWTDDCMEFFIKPSDNLNDSLYFNLEMNCIGHDYCVQRFQKGYLY